MAAGAGGGRSRCAGACGIGGRRHHEQETQAERRADGHPRPRPPVRSRRCGARHRRRRREQVDTSTSPGNSVTSRRGPRWAAPCAVARCAGRRGRHTAGASDPEGPAPSSRRRRRPRRVAHRRELGDPRTRPASPPRCGRRAGPSGRFGRWRLGRLVAGEHRLGAGEVGGLMETTSLSTVLVFRVRRWGSYPAVSNRNAQVNTSPTGNRRHRPIPVRPSPSQSLSSPSRSLRLGVHRADALAPLAADARLSPALADAQRARSTSTRSTGGGARRPAHPRRPESRSRCPARRRSPPRMARRSGLRRRSRGRRTGRRPRRRPHGWPRRLRAPGMGRRRRRRSHLCRCWPGRVVVMWAVVHVVGHAVPVGVGDGRLRAAATSDVGPRSATSSRSTASSDYRRHGILVAESDRVGAVPGGQQQRDGDSLVRMGPPPSMLPHRGGSYPRSTTGRRIGTKNIDRTFQCVTLSTPATSTRRSAQPRHASGSVSA